MKDHVTIPAECCYWVRLAAHERIWTYERVVAAMEPWIPETIDELVIAWTQTQNNEVLAVACPPAVIDAAIAENGPSWLMSPATIPEHVFIPGLRVEALDFLQGPHMPLHRRRFASILRWSAAGITGMTILLSITGAYLAHRHIQRAMDDAQNTVLNTTNSSLPASLGGNDRESLERLEHAQRLVTGLGKAVDGADGTAAEVFMAMVRNWPTEAHVMIQQLTVDGNRCVCSGTAANVEDAQTLAGHMSKALTDQPGWRILPLQTSIDNSLVNFTLTAVREAP